MKQYFLELSVQFIKLNILVVEWGHFNTVHVRYGPYSKHITCEVLYMSWNSAARYFSLFRNIVISSFIPTSAAVVV